MPSTVDYLTAEAQVFSKWYRTVPRIVVASNSNLALTNTDEGYIVVTGTVAGQIITLGIGTSYQPGHNIVIHNASTQSLLIRTNDSVQLATVQAGQRINIYNRENVTTPGVWDYTVMVNVSAAIGDLPCSQSRRTTNYTMTTSWTPLLLDTTDFDNAPTIIKHDLVNTARMYVYETGLYQITYSSTCVETGEAVLSSRLTVNALTEIPGSLRTMAIGTDALSTSVCVVLAAGDYVQLEYLRTGGTTGTVNTQVPLIVTRMQGSKGDQGVPGSGSTVTVKNNGTNVANTPHANLNFAPPLQATDAGGGTALIENLFGQYFTEAAEESGTTTSSATYQLKVRLTTPTIPAGKYRVGWFYEWGLSTTSNNFNGRILQDGATVLWDHVQEPQDGNAAQQQPVGGVQYVTLTAGIHTFDIEYRSQTAGVTARIWDAHLEFWRVPT